MIEELETSLKEIYQSMEDGAYEFATGDFPFMVSLDNYHASMIPFRFLFLLVRINETHMKSLEIGDQG